MVFDTMHSMYSLKIMRARTKSIEDRVNKLLKQNILIWSKMDNLYFETFRPNGINNPGVFHSFVAVIMFITVMGLLPFWGYVVLYGHWREAHIEFPYILIYSGCLFTVFMLTSCIYYGIEVLLHVTRNVDDYIYQISDNSSAPVAEQL